MDGDVSGIKPEITNPTLDQTGHIQNLYKIYYYIRSVGLGPTSILNSQEKDRGGIKCGDTHNDCHPLPHCWRF